MRRPPLALLDEYRWTSGRCRVDIGYSFLSNPYVSAYDDAIAWNKVRSISPRAGICSPEYHRILRRVVVRLVRKHRLFVLHTLFAKLGVIVMYLLPFGNLGLVAAVRSRDFGPADMAFFSALGVSSLPGLLVVPEPNYLLGLIAFSSLFGMISFNRLIDPQQRRPVAPRSRRERVEH